MVTPLDERRRHARFSIPGGLILKLASLDSEGNRIYHGFRIAKDISWAGLCFESKSPVKPSATVTVHMAIKGLPHPIIREARVCWTSPGPDPESPSEIGVKLIHAKQADRIVWDRFIEEHLQKTSP